MSIAPFACLLLAMLLVGPAQAQLPVDTLLTIGDDESAEAEYLFGQISGFARADDGRLFISDVLTDNVRVFDSNGEFVEQIGKRGEGPGELDRPRLLKLTDAGELFVWDHHNHRVQVFGSDTYELVRVLPFGYWSETPPEFTQGDWGGDIRLYPHSDSTFLMLTISAHEAEWEEEPGSDKMFSVITRNLSQILQRFGPFNLVEMPHDFARIELTARPGNAVLTSNNDLWFAPGSYNGELITFEYTSNGWDSARLVDGMRVSGPTYEQLDAEKFDVQDRDHDYAMIILGGRGLTMVGRTLRSSQGLVKAPDGTLLHFTNHVDKEQEDSELTVERFSQDGTLLSVYSFLRELPPRPDAFVIEEIDEAGNLYAIDRTGDAPVIRVLSVEWPE